MEKVSPLVVPHDLISHDLHLSEGSQSNISGGTEGERGPAAMARAVTVHQDTMKVMYFA